MRVSKLTAFGALALVMGTTAAMANVVVVRSLGPSSKAYPPGKTLPESAEINLKGGDVVTLIGPSNAQTFRGPGNFNASKVSLADAAGKRGRFGALRAGEVARNPGVWDIDAKHDGKVCVTENGRIQLWRGDSTAEATVNVRSSDGETATIEWVAGNASVAWPTNIPVVSGNDYTVEWMDTGEANNLTLVKVPGSPDDLAGAAQILIQNGCDQQLNVLVDSASRIAD